MQFQQKQLSLLSSISYHGSHKRLLPHLARNPSLKICTRSSQACLGIYKTDNQFRVHLNMNTRIRRIWFRIWQRRPTAWNPICRTILNKPFDTSLSFIVRLSHSLDGMKHRAYIAPNVRAKDRYDRFRDVGQRESCFSAIFPTQGAVTWGKKCLTPSFI